MTDRTVRIGSASGFWGDTASAAPALVSGGDIDYLVFDYLAEVTMSILAAQKAKDAERGLRHRLRAHHHEGAAARTSRRKGIRVVANAGGVNPLACRDALAAGGGRPGRGAEDRRGAGRRPDRAARLSSVSAASPRCSAAPRCPQRCASVNAYLGALPIAQALGEGCDVVITGRCVDSAVTLGVLMHEFGWPADDYDRLAQGTLAGHLIECGAQCNGGLFTDWETVPDWDIIGFPIVEGHADGSFDFTKMAGTGGLVTPATVAEQMLYEIGDPRAYLVPDVVCDFTEVRFEQVGADRVRITGAKGRPATDTYKVSATFMDGYRNAAFLTIVGDQAAAKARRTGEALFKRMERMLGEQGLPPFSESASKSSAPRTCTARTRVPPRVRSS